MRRQAHAHRERAGPVVVGTAGRPVPAVMHAVLPAPPTQAPRRRGANKPRISGSSDPDAGPAPRADDDPGSGWPARAMATGPSPLHGRRQRSYHRQVEPEDRYDRLILWIVKHVPGQAIAVLAASSYLGLELALPLILNWSALWIAVANLWGTIFAASLALGWLGVQIQARDRRHLLEWSSDLRLLDGEEFEWLVGEVFRREGWAVTERGHQDAPDGYIDLELTRGPERRLVQCKRWTVRWVGVDEIRQLVAALTREKLPTSAGVFVTLSRFNQHAVAEAQVSGLELIDNADLFDRVEKVRRTEPCETCHQPMLLNHSTYGWWFRCVTPNCGGKRHLDKDPGRAVALITEQ